MMDMNSSPRDVNRDRSRRGERQSRFSDASGGGNNNSDRERDRSRERRGPTNRIYVSNIPYEFRWQDLKDLCRELVGDVNFVELFNDENGKPRGCGIVEFKANDSVALAMEKMNRHEINGRHLVIKEDHGDMRDACGRVIRGGGRPDREPSNNSSNRMSSGGGYNRDRDDDRPRNLGGGNVGGGNMSGGGGGGPISCGGDFDSPYNTYGLSTSFLEGLGIQGPLYNKIFIANLDYKVDAKKLKQVFKLAGRIVSVDLSQDKDGNSRGFAVVEYDHPVEAVQAISMFDRQTLFDRRMTVRLDRIPDKGESLKLPEGLKGVGIGLGPNGEPLRNVAYNLRNMNNNNNSGNQNAPAPVAPLNNGVNAGGPANQSAAAAAAAAASILGPAPNNALGGLGNLAAFNSVISNLSGTLSNPLTNPLLASANLSSLGLGALTNSATGGGGVGGVNDQQNSQQGGGGGVGGFNSSQGFQNTYSTPVFNTNLANLRSRNDYDQGNSAVRNYSTQDYGGGGGRGGVGGGQNAYGSAVSSGNSFGGVNSGSNARKSDTIVIKNLPISCNWQLLRDKFREIGEVKHAEMRTPDTGMVRFADEKDAELAIKIMDGARFDNQTVYVSFF